jgi:hypothetical protein
MIYNARIQIGTVVFIENGIIGGRQTQIKIAVDQVAQFNGEGWH